MIIKFRTVHLCFFACLQGLKQIHDVLKYIFLIFPNYCLGRGLIDVAFNEYQNEFYFTTGEYTAL